MSESCACSVWDEIDGFASAGEYGRSVAWIGERIAQGDVAGVPVEHPYAMRRRSTNAGSVAKVDPRAPDR